MNFQNKLIESFASYSGNIAISDKFREITYLDLENSVSKVALFLEEFNFKQELIAIDIDDSINHVIAILGVIFSGNFYISITEENKYYFKNSSNLPIKIVIMSKNTHHSFHHNKCLSIDEILNLTNTYKKLSSINFKNDTQFLCSFITSGSTGKPKVVFHKEKNIYQDTLRQIKDNQIIQRDKIDQVFSLSFSASLATIFPALFTGAELCFFNLIKEGINNLPVFWEEKQISFSSLSVSTYQTLCKIYDSFLHLKSFRFLSLGAEPISENDIELFKNKFSKNTVLQIAYATTETRTITEYKIDNNNHSQKYLDSIGKAVDGKTVFVMSDDGKIQPPLSIGEIVVESSFIADEYFDNPEETRKSFRKANDKIIYYTGDLGYLNKDGYLFYSGRKHDDIKINGIKIDLKLIEYAIKTDKRIKEAVAIIYNQDSDKNYIFVFIQSDKQIEIESLKYMISSKLPFSHLPNFLIKIDKLPLTHTGKINKIELNSIINRIINKTVSEDTVIYEMSSLENKLINVFNKVLKTTNVNPASNFYSDLGIDSLKIIICHSEIEKDLNINLPNYALQCCQTSHILSKFIDFNLFKELVHICPINYHVKGRKSFFIINRISNDNYYSSFIKSAISENFNLSFLYYDLFGIPYRENSLKNILNKMSEIVNNEDGCIVAGYSFNGYIAHQLAAVSPQISFTILFDTTNYFEYEEYKKKKNYIQLLINIVTKLIIENDFGLPVFLVKTLKSKFNNNSEIDFADSIYNKTINYILNEKSTKYAQSNCIVFKATRNYVNNLEHGKNWKNYFSKKFHLFYIKSDHSQILNKYHAPKIAKLIIETCNFS